jgi:adenosylhomocysteine nucleosidase
LCATLRVDDAKAPRLAVLSAFPAELAPLVAAAEVRQTVSVGGRSYHLGTLRGVRIVLGLLGIGMVNATTRTRSVLAHFDVAGVVVSGVAGSPQRIGDVTVPTEWVRTGRHRALRANAALVELARQAADAPTLERCTPVPPGSGTIVCLPHVPVVVVGGRGESGDTFGGSALRCKPGAGDVFGCELPAPAIARAASADTQEAEAQAVDMETAAVARVASRRGVPYVAFRAVSDGAGDPLGLPGFPLQFFAYYRLAAANAAAGTVAFLERLARLDAGDPPTRRVCALLARGRWSRAGARLARMRPPSATAEP